MVSAAIALLFIQIESLPPAQAEERLVAWAISDFHLHLPGRPVRFRGVHPGRLLHPEGVERPLLCGEVEVESADHSAQWIKFATLETRSGFEQWLGGSAAAWCNESSNLEGDRDLSARLEHRMAGDH